MNDAVHKTANAADNGQKNAEQTQKSPYQKAGFFAWAIFIGGMITCLALGTWQVNRLAWKEGLIAKIEAAQTQTPLALADLPNEETTLKPLEFHPVQLTGEWIATTPDSVHVAARYFRGQLGYHIFQPMQLSDGRIAMVNRGWIPAERKELAAREGSVATGAASVKALIRVGADRNDFTPPNQPEKNMFFGRDVRDMAQYVALNEAQLIPATFDVVGEVEQGVLPIPSDGKIKLRNDHLSYIITWYGLAVALLVIFLRYVRVSRR